MNSIKTDKSKSQFLNASKAIDHLRYSLKHARSPYSIQEEIAGLRHLYDFGDEECRYLIVSELISLGYSGAPDFLVDVLKKDNSPLVRHEAAFGLGELRRRVSEITINTLVDALLKDKNEMVRHEAAISLAYVGTKMELASLQEATKDSYQPVVASARFALKSIETRFLEESEDRADGSG